MPDNVVLEATSLSKTVSSPEGPLDHSLRCQRRRASRRDLGHRRGLRRGQVDAPRPAGGPRFADQRPRRHRGRGYHRPRRGRTCRGARPATWDSCSSRSISCPSLTALENVMLPLELRGRRDARQAAAQALEQVGLTPRARTLPEAAVGRGAAACGDRARVRHASPAVLFADEPTGNLDTHTGQRIVDLLFELNRNDRLDPRARDARSGARAALRSHARARCRAGRRWLT